MFLAQPLKLFRILAVVTDWSVLFKSGGMWNYGVRRAVLLAGDYPSAGAGTGGAVLTQIRTPAAIFKKFAARP
jgi:hypothetical protein